MAQNFSVRRAVAADIPAVVDLWKELADFHSARDRRLRRAPGGHEAFASFVGAKLIEAESAVWVAEKDETVVGYCLAMLAERPAVFEDRRHGIISDLVVTEPWRRQRIGHALARVAMDWFLHHGLTRVALVVSSANEVAGGFWKTLGFTPFSTTLSKDI